MKKWRRHIILEKSLITVVLDEVESNKKDAEIEARFHSECEQIVKDGYTLLHGQNGDMALIPVIAGEFIFRPDRHPYLALFKHAQFKWIPYNGTVLNAPIEMAVIAHIILPVENDSEAGEIVNSAKMSKDSSGNLIISFMKDGKTYTYKFKKSKAGLVLE